MSAQLPGRRRAILAALGLAALLAAMVLTPPSRRQPSAAPEPAAAPQPSLDPAAVHMGGDEDWWQAVSRGMAGEEYHASVADGGLQAPNRAQNLRTRFEAHGIAIEPRVLGDAAPGWRFGWETAAIGRPGRMVAAEPPVLHSEGARVTYARTAWSEWYENSPAGVEQGFTLERRPPGQGPLRIAGKLGGGLRAELAGDAVDVFDAHGACVLRYGKLLVEDANGREVPAWLALADGMLAIEMDDRHATYPLLVDPLLFSPSWVGEGNQDQADFGCSVATAGDVNGDGYSDVIVGASQYDNGQTDEGRAFLYLGSSAGLAVAPSWTAESNVSGARFGIAVATAGDVNDDQYSDLIIGAWLYTNGQDFEGRVYVYHGATTGPGATPAWSVEGNQTDAYFGLSVATAGDVNADSYSDVIIGAPGFANGQAGEGRTIVYHGSPSGLGPAPAWTAESDQIGATFGVRVAGAGDVNGDGYADVVVGADLYDNFQADEGRAYVYHGSPAGLLSTPSWTWEIDQPQANLGRAVATAGDVNGDGYSDVIVGAPSFDDPHLQEGVALLFFGGPPGLDTIPGWTAEGDRSLAVFGTSVGTAGDVNGDGYSDVIVGAPRYDNDELREGRAYVYFGAPGGLGAPGWIGEGNQSDSYFGLSAGTAGDVNGDGCSDVIIGAQYFDNGHLDEGRAVVYHGAAAGLSQFSSWLTDGGQTNAGWGWVVAGAGDVNGDGYSDMLAVADRYDSGQGDEGKAWLYYGAAGGLPFTPGWSAETNQVGAELSAAATAGDVNGDGYADVILGSYRYDNGQSDEGRAFLYHGSAGGLAFAPAWTAESDQASAWFASSVGTAGDVNGDGYGDVIIGADGWDNGQSSEGRAWLFLGGSGGLGSEPAWAVEGEQEGASLGYSVGTAGDVNRDGFSDVLVALPSYDSGQADEGVVWVFHGSSGGLGPSPSRVLEVDQAGASFGSRAATAGDVNGDGYSDAIIGANSFDGGQIDEGRAFVYHGGASGLAALPAWTTEPDQASALLGYWLSTAGDVNGDGYSDVFVGAPFYDNGATNEGAAWLYQGSPTGLGGPVWMVEGIQPGAVLRSGGSVGDVNGDGYSDVGVGAPGYTSLAQGDGRVWVYYGGTELDQGFTAGAAGGSGSAMLIDRVPKQLQPDGLTPIQVLGLSSSPTSFRLQARGRSTGGRDFVRLQWEVKPASVPFDGLGLATGPRVDTGAPGGGGSTVLLSELVPGLLPGALYHWRLRVLTDSPFFPHSPWVWLPDNSASEPDVRMAAGTTAVAPQASPGAGRGALEPSAPNPFRTQTRFHYTLAEAGRVRLAVYDAQGRCVRELVDEARRPGRYAEAWDGRNGSGGEMPSGVYFLRLETAGEVAVAQKVVVSR